MTIMCHLLLMSRVYNKSAIFWRSPAECVSVMCKSYTFEDEICVDIESVYQTITPKLQCLRFLRVCTYNVLHGRSVVLFVIQGMGMYIWTSDTFGYFRWQKILPAPDNTFYGNLLYTSTRSRSIEKFYALLIRFMEKTNVYEELPSTHQACASPLYNQRKNNRYFLCRTLKLCLLCI